MSELKKRNDLINSISFSDEEQLQFSAKLWELLKTQTIRYNGINSTSLPVEKAQELMESLVYTVLLVAAEEELSAKELLQEDFEHLLRYGQKILVDRLEALRLRWNQLCMEIPQIQNVYFMDTLRNIGIFFDRYELYYAAHEVPCSIDYPLLHPISEDIVGLSYMEEYIRRLSIELRVIRHYDISLVRELYKSYDAGYKGDFFNLCEPVMVNMIGIALVEGDLSGLTLTNDDIKRLQGYFIDKKREDLLVLFRQAVQSVGNVLHFSDNETGHFDEMTQSLAIRAEAATKTGNLANIFHVFLTEDIL